MTSLRLRSARLEHSLRRALQPRLDWARFPSLRFRRFDKRGLGDRLAGGRLRLRSIACRRMPELALECAVECLFGVITDFRRDLGDTVTSGAQHLRSELQTPIRQVRDGRFA